MRMQAGEAFLRQIDAGLDRHAANGQLKLVSSLASRAMEKKWASPTGKTPQAT
jgi:hypothetical protein